MSKVFKVCIWNWISYKIAKLYRTIKENHCRYPINNSNWDSAKPRNFLYWNEKISCYSIATYFKTNIQNNHLLKQKKLMAAAGDLKTDQNTILCYHMNKSSRDIKSSWSKEEKEMFFLFLLWEKFVLDLNNSEMTQLKIKQWTFFKLNIKFYIKIN